jgi:hypothetical protein
MKLGTVLGVELSLLNEQSGSDYWITELAKESSVER